MREMTEVEAWARWRQHGDEDAKAWLTEHYTVLAERMASKFHGPGLDPDDLRFEAIVALMAALETYDPARETRFTTWAVVTIRGRLRHYRRHQGCKNMGLLRAEWEERARLLARKERGQALTAEEQAWLDALNPIPTLLSLDAPAYDPEEARSFLDFLPAQPGFPTDQALVVRQAVEALPPPQPQMFRLRFWEGLSQEETAKVIGRPQSWVSRVERRAMALLKARLGKAD